MLDELRARIESVIADGKVSYKALAEAARMSPQTLKALRDGRYSSVRSGTIAGLRTALDLIDREAEGVNPHVAAVVAQAKLEMHEFLMRFAASVSAATATPTTVPMESATPGRDALRDAMASRDGSLTVPAADVPPDDVEEVAATADRLSKPASQSARGVRRTRRAQ